VNKDLYIFVRMHVFSFMLPLLSVCLLPFLFIVFLCMYVLFSFDATIWVNKDVYKTGRTTKQHSNCTDNCPPK